MSIIELYKSAFYLNNSYTGLDRLKLLLLHAFVFCFPFDLFYTNIILITYMLMGLLDFKNLNFKALNLKTIALQGFFWLSIAGYAYCSQRHEAGLYLERQLMIFLVPLVFTITLNIKFSQIESLLFTLAGSCVISLLYLFTNVALNILENFESFSLSVAFSGAFFNHYFTTPIGIHAGYFSMYCVISVCVLAKGIISSGHFLSNTIRGGMILILGLGIFFLASRNSTISLVIILLIVLPFFISKQNRLNYIAISAISVFIVGLSIYFTPFLNERFSSQLISDIKPLSNGSEINYNIIEPRIERWKCAWHAIQQSPLFGYGTGDEVAVLQNEYNARGMVISSLYALNAHNTYLSVLIKHGFVGLLAFLLLMVLYSSWAIKTKQFIYIAFLIVLWIGFYTENILDTNKGILFFAVLNTLLSKTNLQDVPEFSRKNSPG